VAPDDWEPTHGAERIATDVVAGVLAHGDGAVVLLHAWPTATIDALDSIVTRLADAGAEFCRIDELQDVPSGVPE
jgi:peptidoglycan/xylan/chitin deacetylase (PgdA/CDA1 family)